MKRRLSCLRYVRERASERRDVGDPLVRLRERWLEGELLIAQGQARAGIQLLETARRAYERHNMRYDAAVIGLEIAHGHLRLGHRAQVRRLLAEVLPVFHDLAVDKDVLVDIVLLRRASGKGQQTPRSG